MSEWACGEWRGVRVRGEGVEKVQRQRQGFDVIFEANRVFVQPKSKGPEEITAPE